MNWIAILSENSFYEFTVILFLAALFGAIGQLLKQPLIVMFIALGIVVGPSYLDIVKSKENIYLLAKIGIAVLLFIVGLKLDLRLIKSTGKIALFTGLGQVFFTSAIGYLIGISLGFSSLHSFYIAVALTFSSTIIIVKLLSDKKEIDSLHGQIAIGFLIVQDLVVIMVMIVLSTLGRYDGSSMVWNIGKTLLSTFFMISLTLVFMKWVIPRLSFFLAKSIEILTLSAVAWAVTLATISELIGFSGEVGAFLAGVSLASSPFKDLISSRLVSLRDFLLLFFFVNLGFGLNLSVIGAQIPAAILFSLFVLIGNPIIVLIIMGRMGYRKRTSFLAGLTVAQISEFSLIFAGMGLTIGHLTEEIVGLITLVGLITIALSTYLILYSHSIYGFLSPILSIFEKKDPYREDEFQFETKNNFDLIIFGLGRFGGNIVRILDKHTQIKYLGVDFDPQVVKDWQMAKKPILYGDLEDPEMLEHLPLKKVKCIINTIPGADHSLGFLKQLEKIGFKGVVFLTALNDRDKLFIKVADNVKILQPHEMAASNFFNSFLSSIFKDLKLEK
ncbi:hypothetical protein P872_09920 [Rhodonellum psychrophilum GCM71 = DSM 17998]|uniref:Sodium/hydrogen exchanger n=2 Tax=Rhodonellum TaxID=336827 RepID=U5BUB2_9BACT|nr:MULTISPECIES: cation:proton antiporter [Rhodonellum]ERM81458.1 hypothetical protein P872_09920 [Rhodonellum psychrophilum GCM71 = DSM 17998]SDZ27523.1 transporter, CPA2 family [Rhodonellum ikkaensis]